MVRFGVWDPHENPGHRPENRYLACSGDTNCFQIHTDNVGGAKKNHHQGSKFACVSSLTPCTPKPAQDKLDTIHSLQEVLRQF